MAEHVQAFCSPKDPASYNGPNFVMANVYRDGFQAMYEFMHKYLDRLIAEGEAMNKEEREELTKTLASENASQGRE